MMTNEIQFRYSYMDYGGQRNVNSTFW